MNHSGSRGDKAISQDETDNVAQNVPLYLAAIADKAGYSMESSHMAMAGLLTGRVMRS
jgi:hypothetical protein